MSTTAIPDERAIRAFWAWFQDVAPRLAAEAQTPRGIAELDLRVSALGELAWEVGPGTASEHMFAISPDGEPELLAVTEAIGVPAGDDHAAYALSKHRTKGTDRDGAPRA